MNGVSLSNYKLFPPKAIAYVSDTSRRGDKMSLGFNDSENTYLVSSISTVFKTDEEQYNKVCAEGYDSDFAKDPHFLNAVAKAPFYAHVTTPSLGFALVTTGGFVTTNDQQVLNEDYQPIEGLYASGNTCGMRFGPEYITPIPGVSIGMCLTLGRELGKYLAAK